ncbi:unnamed protein product [Zymoseptoria tritici ST99CH_3D1]|nr:unnamed protein product [Zymoseptoria tritici ST99CH_3D1]
MSILTTRFATSIRFVAFPRCRTIPTWTSMPGCQTSHRRWRSDESGEEKSKPPDTAPASDATSHPTSTNIDRPLRAAKRPILAGPAPSRHHKASPKPLSPAEQEEFYQYYFNFKPKRSKYGDPESQLLSVDLNSVQKFLPAHLRDRPLEYFAGDSHDLHMAALCLESYISKTAASLSQDERREVYSKSRPGSIALGWLLRNYDHADMSANQAFLRALVHLLVAEANGNQVWSLMSNSRLPKVLLSQSRYDRHAWRGALLRFLVESQTYWSAGTGGINVALRSSEHVWSVSPYIKDRAAYIDGPFVIGKTATAYWILTQLQYKGANSHADARLYDQFIARTPHWQPSSVQADYYQSTLLSKHPSASKSSALPAFEWLRRHYAADPWPEFLRQMLSKWNGFGFIVASARILRHAGYESEARWMLDIGRLEMPDFFTMKHRRSRPSEHAKLGQWAHIQRRRGLLYTYHD